MRALHTGGPVRQQRPGVAHVEVEANNGRQEHSNAAGDGEGAVEFIAWRVALPFDGLFVAPVARRIPDRWWCLAGLREQSDNGEHERLAVCKVLHDLRCAALLWALMPDGTTRLTLSRAAGNIATAATAQSRRRGSARAGSGQETATT